MQLPRTPTTSSSTWRDDPIKVRPRPANDACNSVKGGGGPVWHSSTSSGTVLILRTSRTTSTRLLPSSRTFAFRESVQYSHVRELIFRHDQTTISGRRDLAGITSRILHRVHDDMVPCHQFTRQRILSQGLVLRRVIAITS